MFKHVPVLLKETIDGLKLNKDGIYVDATLGGGGHTEEILKVVESGKGFVIGIDQDNDAIESTRQRLSKYIDSKKLIIKKSNFEDIDKVLDELSVEKIDGALFDLGVSSYQFDTKERGFSYREDAYLDMRMDRDKSFTCYDLVNEFSENDLYEIIRDYGEEKFAKNIAKHIVQEREKKKIETTFDLLRIIKESIPAKCRFGEGNEANPGKRTFQAFRIYINRELEVIDIALSKIIDRVKIGGRVAVITFHSLEDRLVKEKFRTFENPCTCPKGYPCVCGKVSKGKMAIKGITASESELINNRRSKSARLRVFERG